MGNIHRSAVAEQCLKQLLSQKGIEDKFYVMSRGITKASHKNMTEYPKHWSTTKPILENLGIDVEAFKIHKATLIDQLAIDDSYVIFAMDELVFNIHEKSLLNQFPKHKAKIKMFSVIDGADSFNVDDCGDCPDDGVLHKLVNEKIVNTIRNNFLVWIKKEEE